MSSYHIELPARRSAWLADHAYQLRLTEQARILVAGEGDVRLTRLRLAAASMPETRENVQLAERDEVRVRFTFRTMERSTREVAQCRGSRRVAYGADMKEH